MLRNLMFGIIIFLLAFSVSLSISQEGGIVLDLVYLEDPRMPSLTEQDLNVIMDEAAQTLYEKFGIDNISFENHGKRQIKEFFEKWLDSSLESVQDREKVRYHIRSDNDYSSLKDDIMKFLSRWKVWDLAAHFPDKKGGIRTYEDVYPLLMDGYMNRLASLEDLKLSGGVPLLEESESIHQSYLNWISVMEAQKEYDVVFCNGFILYDDLSAPYPHVVLRYAKVGGSSFESPARKRMNGFSAMINLFEMLTDLDYFKESYSDRKIDHETWLKIIGAYIVAHELGHAIYLIPDVYNHDRGCLMDSSYENLDYEKGYRKLKKYPFPCSKCQPYIDARNLVFEGDDLFAKGEYGEAADRFRMAVKMTPDDLDVDYEFYLASMMVKIAEARIRQGNREDAANWVRRALDNNPENPKAMDLKKDLGI